MTERTNRSGLNIARELSDFVEADVLPGLGIGADAFWSGLAGIVADLGPENRRLLQQRATLQGQIDEWHRAHRDKPQDHGAYRGFLEQIGYLVPEGDDFTIETDNIDAAIADVPGPQLVVPVKNARFALNAANARWGSLYDALYGTDVISDEGGAEKGGAYNPKRGAKVIAWARDFLDNYFPQIGRAHV